MKLKMWIGNLDGRRYGLVIATSKVKARAVIGRCSVKEFDDYWSLQDDYLAGTRALLKPDTLYTAPISSHGIRCRTDAQEWFEGRCPLPK